MPNLKQPKDSKLIIISCMKNNARWNNRFFKNLKNIESYFKEVRYVFVEDDSADATRIQLIQFCENRDAAILSTPFISEVDCTRAQHKNMRHYRVQKMARVRNTAMKYVMYENRADDCDYMLIVDADEIGSEIWSEESIMSNFRTDFNWKMICANQPNGYYDIYAYRGPGCDYDCWEEYSNGVGNLSKLKISIPESELKTRVNEILRSRVLQHFDMFRGREEPLKVRSAFGGAAFFNLQWGATLPYFDEETTTCEWISCCARYNGVYVNPKFVNFTGVSHHIHDCYSLIGEKYEAN